ncbi:MAG: archease [Candidatus Niyogibacteria bacterium]|nr:archease [Candidatus Niyogibacteria bacterium]
MPYEFLENTDGVTLRASGATPEELFSESLRGMLARMEPRIFHNNDAEADRVIEISAPDRAALLVDFLGAVLRLALENSELYEEVYFAELTETKLAARLYGREVNQFDREIKAVTAGGAGVRQNVAGVWETEIIFAAVG